MKSDNQHNLNQFPLLLTYSHIPNNNYQRYQLQIYNFVLYIHTHDSSGNNLFRDDKNCIKHLNQIINTI